MKLSTILLGAALYLVSSTDAGIRTNKPFSAITWRAGENEQVAWVDNGQAPSLADIGNVKVLLMVGGTFNQFVADTISQGVPATQQQVSYTVPGNLGPSGSFYFIRYEGDGGFLAFSGMFTIEGVNGNIQGFDPKNPNAPAPTPAPNASATNTTVPSTPSSGQNTPNTGKTGNTGGYGYGYGYGNAASAGSAASSGNAGDNPPPPNASANDSSSNATSNVQSANSTSATNDAVSLFPSLGVATAAIALAFTYLY